MLKKNPKLKGPLTTIQADFSLFYVFEKLSEILSRTYVLQGDTLILPHAPRVPFDGVVFFITKFLTKWENNMCPQS